MPLPNNLTPQMQERLEKWRKNMLPVPSAVVVRGLNPGVYAVRKGDNGDAEEDELDETFRSKQ